MQDIQDLKESTLLANKFFNSRRNTLSKAEEIAQAIILETLKYIESGEIHPIDFVFNYQEIYGFVWGKEETAAKASQTIRSHMGKLIGVFEETSELNIFLQDHNRNKLSIVVHASEGGRKTFIGVVTAQINLGAYSPSNKNLVKYVATLLPKPFFWTKPFIEVALKPRTLGLLLFLSFLIGIYGVVIVLGIVSTGSNLLNAVVILSGLFSIYLYRVLSELINKGVLAIPMFMIPVRQANAFFVLERTDKDSHWGRGLKSVAVVYEAQCGICGDKLIIDKSKEFSGCYVGKCSVAPSEHVFSFDHVLKTGKFIR